MPYRNVNGMLICPVPEDIGLSPQEIEKIVTHTANTMRYRALEQIRNDTIRGKKAERAIETYLRENFNGQICYLSYDEIRTDDFRKHAPFDGLIFRASTPAETVHNLVQAVNTEIENGEVYGSISTELRNKMVDNGVFTFEIKSSSLKAQKGDTRYITKDYKGVREGIQRNDADYAAIVNNIFNQWEFFIFPHHLRNVNNAGSIIDIYSFSEYAMWVWQNRAEYAGITDYFQFLNRMIRAEFDNASEIQTRLYFDDRTNEIYIPGYIMKKFFFIGTPTITRMPGEISGNVLYFTRSIAHCGNSFAFLPADDALWNYRRDQTYQRLYPVEDILRCPRCGMPVQETNDSYFCPNNCGMNLNFLFGYRLSKNEIFNLLTGNKVQYSYKEQRKTAYPSIRFNFYRETNQYVWGNSYNE